MGKISGTLWLIFEFPLNINIWIFNKSRTLFGNLSSVVHSLKTRVWPDLIFLPNAGYTAELSGFFLLDN